MHLEQSNEFELYDICTKFEFKEELIIFFKNCLVQVLPLTVTFKKFTNK